MKSYYNRNFLGGGDYCKQWVELNEIVNAITDKEWSSIFKMARDCQARPKAHLRDIWMNKLDPTNEFFRRRRKRKREEI